MTRSFEEKSVCIQLVAITVAMTAYFLVAGQMLADGVRAMPAFATLFTTAVVGLVVLLIMGHAVSAATNRPEGRDERDRLITLRAECYSSWVVVAGVFGAVACLVGGVDNVWTAHLLLLSLALSEVLGGVLQLVAYRRGL